MTKKGKIIVIAAVSTVVVLALWGNRYATSHQILRNYNPHGVCQALLPECAYCPGKVYFGKCISKKIDTSWGDGKCFYSKDGHYLCY